jgi:Ni/Fe-hydrogenase subunit HybB-like protein
MLAAGREDQRRSEAQFNNFYHLGNKSRLMMDSIRDWAPGTLASMKRPGEGMYLSREEIIHLGEMVGADLIVRGRLGLMFRDAYSLLFWIEIALFAIPMLMLLKPERRRHFPTLFRAAALMLLAGTMYRFDAYLVAFRPGSQWAYFPSLWEILITVGVVSAEIFIYVYIVKRFPVLAGGSAAERA